MVKYGGEVCGKKGRVERRGGIGEGGSRREEEKREGRSGCKWGVEEGRRQGEKGVEGRWGGEGGEGRSG